MINDDDDGDDVDDVHEYSACIHRMMFGALKEVDHGELKCVYMAKDYLPYNLCYDQEWIRGNKLLSLMFFN